MSSAPKIRAVAPSEEHCIAIKPGGLSESKQGHHVFEGISAESAGSRALCMHVIVIAPGGRARAHLHEDHESAVYMVEGEVICWYGDHLEHRFTVRAGEMAYIPAGVPHLPINASEDEPVTCIVARTDPNEQESVVLLPELEALTHTRPPAGNVVELDSVRR
ncbi:MAG: cupin domain-containing protein [Solirubrobacteraceae bacterium]